MKKSIFIAVITGIVMCASAFSTHANTMDFEPDPPYYPLGYWWPPYIEDGIKVTGIWGDGTWDAYLYYDGIHLDDGKIRVEMASGVLFHLASVTIIDVFGTGTSAPVDFYFSNGASYTQPISPTTVTVDFTSIAASYNLQWVDIDGNLPYCTEISSITAEPIPEPTTMLLLGTGLVGIAGAARRRRKKQA